MSARARAALPFCTRLGATAAAASDQGRRTAWSAAPESAGPELPARALRQVARTTTGGTRVRIRPSNLFGTAPLTVGAAHVGLSAGRRACGGRQRPPAALRWPDRMAQQVDLRLLDR